MNFNNTGGGQTNFVPEGGMGGLDDGNEYLNGGAIKIVKTSFGSMNKEQDKKLRELLLKFWEDARDESLIGYQDGRNQKEILDFVSSLLSLREQEMWDKIEKKKLKDVPSLDVLEGMPMNETNIKTMVRIACDGRQNNVLSDIQSLLKK